MTRKRSLVDAFAVYLRRVAADTSGEVVILAEESDQAGGTTRSAPVRRAHFLVSPSERSGQAALTRRFSDWTPGLPLAPDEIPVEISDCWDPEALPPTPDSYDVLALVTTFNEIDIIDQLINRLRSDQIRVHVVDNWSTDGTFERLEQLAQQQSITLERFPANGPTGYFELQPLLQRVEDLAHLSGADWVIHHDADEIREPPWPRTSLRRALYVVAMWGFNCVDHTVINFRPIDDSWHDGDDLAGSFPYFEFGDGPALFVQYKAWKPQLEQVAMAATGGHNAEFQGRRVFPYKFVTRHYPIRSQAHGERKIVRERQSRWSPAERARGWHTHYDHYGEGSSFIWDRAELYRWDEIDHRFLLERLSGVGLPGNPWPGEQGPHGEQRPFADAAYAASIELRSRSGPNSEAALGELYSNELRALTTFVTNNGDEVWLRAGRNDIGLSSKWFAGTSPDLGAPPRLEGARSQFTADVRPGESIAQPLIVQAPSEPGEYTLLIDLVHERIRWFGCGITLQVRVTSR